jgi:hypothetical protein
MALRSQFTIIDPTTHPEGVQMADLGWDRVIMVSNDPNLYRGEAVALDHATLLARIGSTKGLQDATTGSLVSAPGTGAAFLVLPTAGGSTGDPFFGIVDQINQSGVSGSVTIQRKGYACVTASAAITAGQLVVPGTARGGFIPYIPTMTGSAVGQAVSTQASSGSTFEIFLF